MRTLLKLLCLVSFSIHLHAKEYNGCDHYRQEQVGTLCNRAGFLSNPAPLGPQFKTTPRNGTSALQVCEYTCFDNIYCHSFAYRASDTTCRLLGKALTDQGFVQTASDTRFWSATCSGGTNIPFGGSPWFSSRFDVGTNFQINPKGNPQSPYWELETPDRCKDGKSLRIRPPLAEIIRMKANMNLGVIGGDYILRVDYMYQNPDPLNIIFGYLSYNDGFNEIDQLFELARADNGAKDGVWQRKEFRFDTDRTKKYTLTLEVGRQPGANATKRTTWRLDNLVIHSAP